MSSIELRCPNTHAKLLGRIIRPDWSPESKLRLEIACPECKRVLRRTGAQVSLVLFTFDAVGRIVDSKVKP